ncbi:hypothetical protein FOL47_002840 [Perkinsus chesapeaki]|uniref:Uncharacterized protein n=1 Tax=Perkinsus chesapeaki TaxID=330153 RepID=A0A7J6MB93_PERCH|nr:hypothetical protein FOL47_002840 [Perkinsus chesapeaki]
MQFYPSSPFTIYIMKFSKYTSSITAAVAVLRPTVVFGHAAAGAALMPISLVEVKQTATVPTCVPLGFPAPDTSNPLRLAPPGTPLLRFVSPTEVEASGKKSCTIRSSDGSKITVYSEPAAGGSIYPKTTAQCKIGGVMRSVFQFLRGLERIFGDKFSSYFFKMDCKEVFRNTGIQASSNDEGVAEMCRKLTS